MTSPKCSQTSIQKVLLSLSAYALFVPLVSACGHAVSTHSLWICNGRHANTIFGVSIYKCMSSSTSPFSRKRENKQRKDGAGERVMDHGRANACVHMAELQREWSSLTPVAHMLKASAAAAADNTNQLHRTRYVRLILAHRISNIRVSKLTSEDHLCPSYFSSF